jgi:hypothetical protein
MNLDKLDITKKVMFEKFQVLHVVDSEAIGAFMDAMQWFIMWDKLMDEFDKTVKQTKAQLLQLKKNAFTNAKGSIYLFFKKIVASNNIYSLL